MEGPDGGLRRALYYDIILMLSAGRHYRGDNFMRRCGGGM